MQPIPTPIQGLSGVGTVMRIRESLAGKPDWYVLERVPNAHVPYFGWPYGTYLPVVNKSNVIPLDNDGKVFVPLYRVPLAVDSAGEIVSAYGWIALSDVRHGVSPTKVGFANYGTGRVALHNSHGLSLGTQIYFDSNGTLEFGDLAVISFYGFTNYYRNLMFSASGTDQVAVAVART